MLNKIYKFKYGKKLCYIDLTVFLYLYASLDWLVAQFMYFPLHSCDAPVISLLVVISTRE